MKAVSISSLSVSTPFTHVNTSEPMVATALGIEALGISLDPCPQKTGNRLLIQKLSKMVATNYIWLFTFRFKIKPIK